MVTGSFSKGMACRCRISARHHDFLEATGIPSLSLRGLNQD